jgi:hypothetical protein
VEEMFSLGVIGVELVLDLSSIYLLDIRDMVVGISK